MLIRLLFILRRRWPLLLLLPIVAAGIGYAFTPRGDAVVPTAFTATAVIAVDQSSTAIEVQQTILETQQGSIAQAVADDVGGGISAEDVGSRVEADLDEESFVVTLTVSGDSKGEAERYARAISGAFVERGNSGPIEAQQIEEFAATQARNDARDALVSFQRLNQAVLGQPVPPPQVLTEQEALQSDVAQAESALDQIEGTSIGEAYRLVNVTSASRSVVDQLQIPASVALRVSLGLVFGLIGAVVLVAIVEKLNPRIDDPLHATEIVGAPVLAMVPVMGRRRGRRKALGRATPEGFRGPFAEAFRSARTHLDFRAAADGRDLPARIMITSATPTEGKSTTAAFLALAFAEAGRRPVVVGADLRRPSVHTMFGIERTPGLTSRAVGGGSSVPLSEIVKTDPVTRVSVIPSGPSIDRVTGLLGDLTAVTLAGQAAGRPVIVDTAPVMVANDAIDFLVAVDWVVVVIRVGRSTERAVKQMMQSLTLTEAQVVGVIMVGSLESADAKRYYYSYYNDDGSGEREITRRVVSPSPADGSPVPTVGNFDFEPDDLVDDDKVVR